MNINMVDRKKNESQKQKRRCYYLWNKHTTTTNTDFMWFVSQINVVVIRCWKWFIISTKWDTFMSYTHTCNKCMPVAIIIHIKSSFRSTLVGVSIDQNQSYKLASAQSHEDCEQRQINILFFYNNINLISMAFPSRLSQRKRQIHSHTHTKKHEKRSKANDEAVNCEHIVNISKLWTLWTYSALYCLPYRATYNETAIQQKGGEWQFLDKKENSPHWLHQLWKMA